ncbi:hypothetical protein ACOSQ3_001934 [Xanthoceras sorbifolium]
MLPGWQRIESVHGMYKFPFLVRDGIAGGHIDAITSRGLQQMEGAEFLASLLLEKNLGLPVRSNMSPPNPILEAFEGSEFKWFGHSIVHVPKTKPNPATWYWFIDRP